MWKKQIPLIEKICEEIKGSWQNDESIARWILEAAMKLSGQVVNVNMNETHDVQENDVQENDVQENDHKDDDKKSENGNECDDQSAKFEDGEEDDNGEANNDSEEQEEDEDDDDDDDESGIETDEDSEDSGPDVIFSNASEWKPTVCLLYRLQHSYMFLCC